MYKARLREPVDRGAKMQSGYIEMDPSSRYGRFKEILGKGATKTVYRAFDEFTGMEVAWNQVKLNDVFQSPVEFERLYSEVHLLKNLDHPSLMRFYTFWIDVERRTFNFITEMFTSGTLREYKQMYNRVNIRAVKDWSRQILEGVAYLHGHEPPVIHRDLKCDNIFVNGHLGQVKIGDLGLAATLHCSQHAHSVIGTPEFMAPELYDEEYDELVDIYSFGMCVLEMLTSEYPYSECSNPAQIYKKVTSGKLPKAFYQIEDNEARQFVGNCLEAASKRPSAKELLMDPFLAQAKDNEPLLPLPRRMPTEKPVPCATVVKMPPLPVDSTKSTDMKITGTMNPEDDAIFLKVKISHKDGQARNIYFPFDTLSDTPLDVAMEMVKELDITDWEPFEIAQMIEDEISALVPTWEGGGGCHPLQNQHSFNYHDEEDDDDKINNHPFYSLSSHSSSQASLPGLFTSSMTQSHHWSQEEDFLINDDVSSHSSLNSYKYSNFSYYSGIESDLESRWNMEEPPHTSSNSQKCTRFCPEERSSMTTKKCEKHCINVLLKTQRACNSSTDREKIMRMQSMVEFRSQLLHRSLVEEVNKRRLFKTVGAVQDIGFHEPW